MPRRRTMQAMEKDAQAADLYRRGLSYRQIAAQLGWKTPSAAHEAVRRAALDAAGDRLASAEALSMMLERLQDYRRVAWRVASTKHFATTNAGVAVHPETDEPLLDDGPVLQALDRLAKFDDLEAKLRGLYAPTQARVTVIPEDAVDAEVKRLMQEIEDRERALADADHPGTA